MKTLGVLGLGEGRSAMSAALSSKKINLHTICDRNIEICKQREAEFGFHRYSVHYEDLLNNPEIDIIAIYTSDHLHAQHIKMALEHNKHVICTKPLFDDLKDAQSLLELSRQMKKQIFVGQSSRFFAPILKQREDFMQGEIGDIISLEAYYNADHRWFLGKGWSLDKNFKWLYAGLSHPVDLLRWYLPNIEEVFGYATLSVNGKDKKLVNEDCFHFVYKTVDGRIARVSGAYSGPVQPGMRDSHMSCIVRGTEGCSQGDYMDLRYAITNKQGEEKVITFDEQAGHYFRFGGRSHHAGEYQNYFDYFVDSIEKDQIAYPDLTEGIGTIAVLKAMEQSLALKRPVKVVDVLSEFGLELSL